MLQDEVDAEVAVFDRNRIFDVISDKIAARSPISEKHKGLEVKWGKTEQKNNSMLHNVNVLTILFVPVTVFSLYSLPSSAALTQSRCNTGSEGSVWGNTARPAWPRRRACIFSLANRSTWLWGTWNHDYWPPRRHKVRSPKLNSCGDADSTSEHTRCILATMKIKYCLESSSQPIR